MLWVAETGRSQLGRNCSDSRRVRTIGPMASVSTREGIFVTVGEQDIKYSLVGVPKILRRFVCDLLLSSYCFENDTSSRRWLLNQDDLVPDFFVVQVAIKTGRSTRLDDTVTPVKPNIYV